MPEESIWFEWEVAKSGYCWREDWESGLPACRISGYAHAGLPQSTPETERFLVVNTEISRPPETKSYSPLKTTGLFLDFSSLEPEDAAIVAFADRWGLLTNSEVIVSSEVDEGLPFPGEPRSLWTTALLRMKYLVKLWRMVEGSDRIALQRVIEWHDLYNLHGFYSGGDGTGFDRHWIPWPPPHSIGVKRGDVVAAARHALTNRVNEAIRGSIHPELVSSSRGARPSLHLVPQDLLSGLWLQFARAIAGGKEYSRCDHCGGWFEISSPEGGRVDKKYCSPACRARRWRAERHQRAGAEPVTDLVPGATQSRTRW